MMSKKKISGILAAIVLVTIVFLAGREFYMANVQRQEQRRLNQLKETGCCEYLFRTPADRSDTRSQDSSSLRGEAFTDPLKMVQMTKQWGEQPIRYDKWAKGSDIALSLDQHLYHAILPVIEAYAKDRGLKIAVQEGTCGVAGGMIVRKQVDIAGYCCPAGDVDRMPGLQYHTLGIAAVGILVNKDNPVSNLPLNTVRAIFQGKYFKWSEIMTENGKQGPDMLIQAVARLHCPNRPGHWRLLLDNPNLFGPRVNEVGTIEDMLAQIASNKGAIGHEVPWNIHRYGYTGKIKFINIDGYSPVVPEHLLTLRYDHYRTYILNTWEGKSTENPEAKKLVAYLLNAAEHLDSGYGIIPASQLRKNGWKFQGDELIGEPE